MTKVEEIFNLYKSHHMRYTKRKEDFHDVYPTSSTGNSINNPTAEILFEVGSTDSFLDISKAHMVCKMKINIAANKNISLEPNFFPKMFSSMSLKIGSKNIETIDSPGEISDILNIITLPKDYQDTVGSYTSFILDSGDAKIYPKLSTAQAVPTQAEFNSLVSLLNKTDLNEGFRNRQKYFLSKSGAENKDANIFTIMFPLSPLFGILDHKAVSSQIPWTLRLKKEVDYNKLFYGDVNTTIADILTFQIEKLFLRIPNISPSLELEAKLNKELISGKIANLTFLGRNISIQQPINGTSYTWDIAKSSNNPRFLFLIFKKSGNPSILENSHRFLSHIDNDNFLKDIQVLIDNKRYPQDPVLINEGNTTNDINIYSSYDYFVTLCAKFGNIAPIDRDNFMKNYFLLCFDLTSQEENSAKKALNIQIKINKKGFNQDAYCLILEDKFGTIDYLKNTIDIIN